MLSVNFDYFIIKKRNAEFYQYPVNNTNVNSLAKTTLSSLWNKISKKLTCNKKFLNRVAEKTKIVQGKTFIPTNNYDLFYLKQLKRNPSLSLLVKSSKYDKWKPIQISESPILFKLL